MTPMVSPSTLETVSFAAWSSIRTLSRTKVTIRLFPPLQVQFQDELLFLFTFDFVNDIF